MVQQVTESLRPSLQRSPIEKRESGSPVNLAAEKIGPEARPGTAPVKQICLHDTRMKDELEEYRDRIANSK